AWRARSPYSCCCGCPYVRGPQTPREIERISGLRMSTPNADRKSIWWACVLLTSVSFLAYAPVWRAYFLADDFAYVGLYANRPFTEWVGIFAKDWTRGVWGYQMDELRPMMALAFWWDGTLWPFHPLGYHTTNILFHAACSIMVLL